MSTLLDDVRYAIRSLVRAPGFTLLAVAVLALGIGASTAMFSAVKHVLLDSVAYPEPGQLAMLWGHGPDSSRQHVAFGTFSEWRARSRSFAAIAALAPWQAALTGVNEAERLQGQRVTADYFEVLGIAMSKGSGLDAAEDRPGGLRTVVISDSLWQRRFDADPAIIGRAILLDEQAYSIVGVMPAGFKAALAPAAEVWTLLQYDAALPVDGREWGLHLRVLARLHPQVTRADAAAEIMQLASAPVAEFVRPAHASMQHGTLLTTMQEELTRAVRPGLLSALAAVVLLLLIACVNVANLLLVRGSQRSGEFATRAALGASPAQLLRQLLLEHLLLACGGAVLGLLLAHFALAALTALAPPDLASIGVIAVDRVALAFASASACIIGVLVGLAPALRAARAGQRSALQNTARGAIGGQRTVRQALVVAQLALAVVVLVSAGLLMSSLQRLYAVDPGFEAQRLLTLQLHISGQRFHGDPEATHAYYGQLLDALHRVPGVRSAAYTNQLPLSGELLEYGVQIETLAGKPSGRANAVLHAVSPDYFASMGIPLLAGRTLTETDTAQAEKVVVISASLARSQFGEQSPLGKRLRIGPDDSPWHSIVGISGDVHQLSLAAGPPDAVYVPSPQWRFAVPGMSFVVRTSADPGPLLPTIAEAIRSVDPDLPISGLASMQELLQRSAGERRFASMLFAAFGLAALVLAAIGIYGALAVDVAERRSEIGLRMALGASVPAVLRWVLRRSLLMLTAGVLLGLLLASATTRVLQSLLYDITATDPATFMTAAAVLMAVACIACLHPLRQALRVDPVQALRSE